MPRHLLIAASLILALSSFASAEIYKTVDKNGRITYTDVPPANTEAKPLELKTINSLPTPTAMPHTSPINATTNNKAPPEYRIQILAPENGTTLLANERSVVVSIVTNQNLSNGDLFAYKLDGSILTTIPDTTYTITEPPRGEHILTVEVVDTEGKPVAQSNAITLLVMRPLPKQKAVPVPKK
jgi:hypothetical protein